MTASAPALVYVAGPYSAPTQWEVEQNVRRAEACGAEVVRLGAYPVIPHCNTRGWFTELQPAAWWYLTTEALLLRCDALVVCCDDYSWSVGTLAEVEAALSARMPVFVGERRMDDLSDWLATRGGTT